MPGQSAAAPFGLYVGLVALFYDIVFAAGGKRFGDRPVRQLLLCWLLVLLYLTAEATGRLWIYTLLIKQPQIYMLTALMYVLYAADREPESVSRFYLYGGLFVAFVYLLKAAPISMVPGLLLLLVPSVCGAIVGRYDEVFPRRLAENAVGLFLPLAAVMIV